MDGDLGQDFPRQGDEGRALRTEERKTISRGKEAATGTEGFLVSEAYPCWEKVGPGAKASA